MKKKNHLKSNCCNSKIKIQCSPDEIDKIGCTMYHICLKCKEACDVHISDRKTWKINPKTQIIPNKKKKKSTKLTPKELRELHKSEDY